MKRSDGIPQLIIVDERSKRDTVELCCDEQLGLRCVLEKGHTGMHESLVNAGRTRWESAKAS
jgi:hypothetical protein